GVLMDGAILSQSIESFETVFKPKVYGAWNLHEICYELDLNKNLNHFVLFSSVASLLGNFGQTNYSAANACLDSLANHRQKHGLSCLSIQWGPWIDQGMAVDLKQHLEKVGLYGISNELGIRALNDLLCFNISSTIACQIFNWEKYLKTYIISGNHCSLFSKVAEFSEFKLTSRNVINTSGMSREEVYDFVLANVLAVIEQIIGTSLSPMKLNTPFSEIGMDSLSAIEFKNALISKFGIKIPSTALFDYPTLKDIVEYLTDSLFVEESKKSSLETPYIINSQNTPIAVIGISCRLPGDVMSSDDLWDKVVLSGNYCIEEIPLDRWVVDYYYDPDPDNRSKSYVNKGAFIRDIDLFDNIFFGMSPTEAMNVDPQQKLMLEISYEAMYSCGITKRGLSSVKRSIQGTVDDPSMTGVFVGCCNSDWHFLQTKFGLDNFTSYTGSGGAGSLVSNRISYSFGFRGPSQTIDTACSSSLVAVDAAVAAIRNGLCHSAIAGGVNLMLSPHLFVAFCRARMLSPDCMCKTFDAAANGYARGEGCASVYITSKTQINGKPILPLAYILGAATNHNGRSASLTAPNGPAQAEVIKTALLHSRITPNDIDYIETHGTGTALGDPIEFGALRTIFGSGTKTNVGTSVRSHPLVLGALKTNIGHLEGAAGIAGVIKLILVLQHKKAPKILHLKNINPHLDTEGFDVVLPKEIIPLEKSKSKHIGGVSSFGFGGCNAHVIIQTPPKHSEEETSYTGVNKPYIVFMYTGQGSQYVDMCKDLYESEPVFRDAMNLCDKLFSSTLNQSLIDIIYPKNPTQENNNVLSETSFTQPAIFAIEYSLTKLWESIGIQPSAVMGHSLGEFAAAVVSGVMTIQEGATLVAHRAAIISSLPTKDGVMAACRASEEQVLKSIKNFGLESTVSVAAINGPKNVTISGSRSSVMKIISDIGMESRYKLLDVSHAFHSPLVSEAETELEKFLDCLDLKTPQIRFISCITGNVETSLITKKTYWTQHILHPVRFYDSIQTATSVDEKCIVMLEIGPKVVLSNMAKQAIGGIFLTPSIPDYMDIQDIFWIASVNNISGMTFKNAVQALNKCSEIASLDHIRPIWNKHRFHWEDLTSFHPLLNKYKGLQENGNSYSYTTDMINSKEFNSMVCDHVIFNMQVIPAAALIEIFAVTAFKILRSKKLPSSFIELNSMDIEKPLVYSSNETISEMEVIISDINGSMKIKKKLDSFDIYDTEYETENQKSILNASISSSRILEKEDIQVPSTSLDSLIKKFDISKDTVKEFPVDLMYATMNEIGLQYGPMYQCLTSVRYQIEKEDDNRSELEKQEGTYKNTESNNLNQENECKKENPQLTKQKISQLFCYIKYPNSNYNFEVRIHPSMIDAAFQASSAFFADSLLDIIEDFDISNIKNSKLTSSLNALVPIGFKRCIYGRHAATKGVWSLVELKKLEKTGDIAFIDVTLWDSNTNEFIAFFEDVTLKRFQNAAALFAQDLRIPHQILWRTKLKRLADLQLLSSEVHTQSLIDTKEDNEKPCSKTYHIVVFGVPKVIQKLLSEYLNKFNQYLFTFIDINTRLTTDFLEQTIQEENWDLIFYLGALLPDLPACQTMGDILKIVQVISSLAISLSTPPFICLSRYDNGGNETTLIEKDENQTNILDNQKTKDSPSSILEVPKHSGISGFVKTARVELENVIGKFIHISHVECCSELVDDPYKLLGCLEFITRTVINCSNDALKNETDLILCKNDVLAPRLENINFPILGSLKMVMNSRGAITNLKLKPLALAERSKPIPNTVEIRVRSIGLNFRDVLN
ncbi:hypothetical protein ACR3K2_35190, partial [Cryptosporidium serpentis]